MGMYFEQEQMMRWMKGDSSAVECIELICNIAHIWDDLIDKDKELSGDTINRVFFEALITLPRNPFYRKHFDHLNSVLLNAISNWQIANRLEREGGSYETSIAFILRSSYVDMVTQAALLQGGQKWGWKVGEEVRRLAHGETYDGYLKNLDKEKTARQAVAPATGIRGATVTVTAVPQGR